MFRRGITILELVLVIAIVAVSAGIIGPRVTAVLTRQTLDKEFSRYVSWFRKAQSEAVVSGKEHEIVQYGNGYKVFRIDGGKRVELAHIAVDKAVKFYLYAYNAGTYRYGSRILVNPFGMADNYNITYFYAYPPGRSCRKYVRFYGAGKSEDDRCW